MQENNIDLVLKRHNHDGLTAEQIELKNAIANRVLLTTVSGATATSSDAAIINNLRTRLNELEACLKSNNILL